MLMLYFHYLYHVLSSFILCYHKHTLYFLTTKLLCSLVKYNDAQNFLTVYSIHKTQMYIPYHGRYAANVGFSSGER